MGLLKFLAANPVVAILILAGAAKMVKKLAEWSTKGPGGEVPQQAPVRLKPGASPSRPVQTVRPVARPSARAPTGASPGRRVLRRRTVTSRKAPGARPVPKPLPPARVAPARLAPEAEGPRHDTRHPVTPHAAPHVPPAPEPEAAAQGPTAAALFAGGDSLRRAVLMAEILGRPKSLR